MVEMKRRDVGRMNGFGDVWMSEEDCRIAVYLDTFKLCLPCNELQYPVWLDTDMLKENIINLLL